MTPLAIAITGYTAASVAALYLFLMQRASLEISRANDIDARTGRQMLPLWYNAVWPSKIVRWVCLYFIWRDAGWLALASFISVVMVATAFSPVPFAHFLPVFKRKLSRDMGTAQQEAAPRLLLALLRLGEDGRPTAPSATV